jgi:uncharacterized protein
MKENSLKRLLNCTLLMIVLLFGLGACSGSQTNVKDPAPKKQESNVSNNPVLHFEIPVTDIERAVVFYETVFEIEMKRDRVDGYDMAFFPRSPDKPGASGALAKGDVYKPSKQGPIIYFDVPDIDPVIERATKLGAKVLYAKKHIGDAGYVAEIEDSEGNRLALSAISD